MVNRLLPAVSYNFITYFLHQLTDTMGRSKTCVRSMQTKLLKTGKSQFETLDSTVITEDGNGKREETGKRVDDVNIEMASAMGVSKAILNNVIFCHQEDSCWPLDEGKKLKEKFDDIFGTTEYNKAIDRMIKIRKKREIEMSKCGIEKRHLLQAKIDADKKQLEFDLLNKKHEELLVKIEKLDGMLVPLEEAHRKLMKREAQYGELHGKKTVLEMK